MFRSNHARRAALLGVPLLGVLGALLSMGAGAQGYPDKPLRLVVPFGTDSFPDVVARTVGQKLAEGPGQPVVIDNRVGAGGNLGSEAVLKAAPDGYTILLHTVANAIDKSLVRNLSFDPLRDLAPVGQVAVAANVLVVPPSLGVTTFGDFLARARTRRPELGFAAGGNGTPSHLAAQLLKSMAPFGAEHVPYKNFSQALTDVIAGQPQFVIPNLPPTMPHMQSGRLGALAQISRSADTYMVFSGDHGEWLGDHGLLFKGPMPYAGLLRVGLIVRGPAVPAAKVVPDPVSTLERESGADELYDLVNGPDEIDKRFDHPAVARVRRELQAMIAARPDDALATPLPRAGMA